LTIDGAEQDEIISYSELIDMIETQEQQNLDDPEGLWTFKEIIAHVGPLESKDPTYKGSLWNVMVQWEDGAVTSEPLNIIASDDPVSCAQYAKQNGLLEKEVLIANREKKLLKIINQSRMKSVRRAPPPGLRVHYIFAVKHDLRHKARLVADGHLTAPLRESVYSGVAYLLSLRI
jgi:hypothetical protein